MLPTLDFVLAIAAIDFIASCFIFCIIFVVSV